MRPFKQQSGKPAYVQKREDAEREQRESQDSKDHLEAINRVANELTAIRNREQSVDDKREQRESDYLKVINRVANELMATRNQEQRDDDKRAFREKTTIALLVATVIAAGLGDVFFYGQMSEMQRAYGPIADQADAAKTAADAAVKAADAATKQSENSDKSLIQAQRAWAGPRNASFAAEPTVGKPVEIAIDYQNSGHEPAVGFVYFTEPFLISQAEGNNGVAIAKIQNYMQSCQATKEWQGGSVIYPTVSSGFGGGGYSLTLKSKDDLIDDDVVKGDNVVIVQGCFLYRTFATARHSYFCYFYKQGMTKIQSLNICPSGHYAD